MQIKLIFIWKVWFCFEAEAQGILKMAYCIPEFWPLEFEWFEQTDIAQLFSLERLSKTLRQTANGKNETFAVCLKLSVK